MAARALSNQMNRVVRVNRLKLIETLKNNRANHIVQFNEAMAGYKEAALSKIDEAFDNLENRLQKRKSEIIESIQKFTAETAGSYPDVMTVLQSVTVNLKVPRSYEDAYDAAIDMAQFDTREELDLSGAEFQCFCRDVWDWSNEFADVSVMYAGFKKS